MEHQPLCAFTRSRRERAGDCCPEAQATDIEFVDSEFGEKIEEQIRHRPRRMTPGKWRRGTVAGEIRNDQRAMGPELAEPAAEFLGRAEKPVAQHQRFSPSTDEIAQTLASDRRETLVHHRRITVCFRRDPGGQSRVKSGRRCINGVIKATGWVTSAVRWRTKPGPVAAAVMIPLRPYASPPRLHRLPTQGSEPG